MIVVTKSCTFDNVCVQRRYDKITSVFGTLIRICFLWKFLYKFHPSVATKVLAPELSNSVRRTFAASSMILATAPGIRFSSSRQFCI